MKKRFFLLIICLPGFLFLLNGCGGIFMNDDSKNLIGLWRSSGWDDSDEICYYDFRDNGRVFVTDWSDDLETTNNPIVPNYFNYSVVEDILKMSQVLGFIKFEFSMSEDSGNPGNAYYLYVQEETFDYYELDLGGSLYLERLDNYTDEARRVKACLEGFNYE